MRRLEIKSERWSDPELKPLVSESEGLLERESKMGRVSRRDPLTEGAGNLSKSDPMGSRDRKLKGGFPRTFPSGFWSMLNTDCVLLWAVESESWVLQGRSQPVRLSDCRPRHKPFASVRPWGDSCAEVGKSILLVTVSSESWKSALERRTAKQTPRVKGCFPSTISNKYQQ